MFACVIISMPYKDSKKRREAQRRYYHRRKEIHGPRVRTPDQREKQRVSQRKYDRKRAKDDIWKLKNRLRVRVRCALKAQKYNGRAVKSKGTMVLIGCTPRALRTHLQEKFTEGMGWHNYGKWHIDHIRPCASFDLTCKSQQQACFHYSNLQPLWAIDNLKKGAKENYVVAN